MAFSPPMDQKSSKPPIFIVGCPRSGTGLFRDLLRSHPNLTFPHESHFIPQLYRAYGDPVSEAEAVRLAKIVLNLYWVQNWGLELLPASFAACRSYNKVITTLYEAWAERDGRDRWGDKTPQNVLEIETLVEIFPSCQILHLVRDGRDVSTSWIRTSFGPENVYAAATAWKRHVEIGRLQGSGLAAGQYLELTYEELLQHPEGTLRRVCSFLGETFCHQMLKPRRMGGHRRRLVGKEGKSFGSRKSIVAENINKWKREMPVQNRILFESVAGNLLRQLGFETEGKTRSVSGPERLMWLAHDQVRGALKRINLRYRPRWIASALRLRWSAIRSKLQ